jgi:hypothetical protein
MTVFYNQFARLLGNPCTSREQCSKDLAVRRFLVLVLYNDVECFRVLSLVIEHFEVVPS